MEHSIINELKNLHKEAFEDSDQYINFFFENRYSEENTYTEYYNNTLASVAYARFIEIYLNGKKLHIPFLNGIATHNEFRNLGYASKVIEKSCQNLAARNYPFVLLHPFKHVFYEKLNFTTINFTKKRKIVNDFTTKLGKNNYNYRLVKKEDIAILTDIYSSVMIEKKAYNKRSSSEWHLVLKEHFADNGYGYIIFSVSVPVGYCLIYADDTIRELVTNDLKSFSTIKTLEGKSFISFDSLKNKHTMGKVLSVENTLYFLPFNKKLTKIITIKVEYDTYKLQVNKGQVEHASILKSESMPELIINSKDLLEIVFGLANLSKSLTPLQKELFETYNFILFDTY